VRVLLSNNGGAINLAVGVAGDAGVKEYADLKGKRVAWVKGAPALNVNVTAYLAYAGLTWDDVTKVEFGGFSDSWKGMVNGQVDAAFASTNSGKAYEMAASPRGLVWPRIHHDNKEGIARMQAIAPFFAPNVASVGANIDGGPGYEGAGYAYPVLVAMVDQDAELVYNMTRAMVELFGRFRPDLHVDDHVTDGSDHDWVLTHSWVESPQIASTPSRPSRRSLSRSVPYPSGGSSSSL